MRFSSCPSKGDCTANSWSWANPIQLPTPQGPTGKGGCWKDRSLWHDHRWACLPWESCPAPSQPTESAHPDANPNMKWHQGKMIFLESRSMETSDPPALSMRGRLSSFSLSIIFHVTLEISGVHSVHCPFQFPDELSSFVIWALLYLLLSPEILTKEIL